MIILCAYLLKLKSNLMSIESAYKLRKDTEQYKQKTKLIAEEAILIKEQIDAN